MSYRCKKWCHVCFFVKIKNDSYDSLPLEKILTLHSFIILTKSFLNKGQNHYYYNMFFEKCSYQLAAKTMTIFFVE